jgi:hypothetical protein
LYGRQSHLDDLQLEGGKPTDNVRSHRVKVLTWKPLEYSRHIDCEERLSVFIHNARKMTFVPALDVLNLANISLRCSLEVEEKFDCFGITLVPEFARTEYVAPEYDKQEFCRSVVLLPKLSKTSMESEMPLLLCPKLASQLRPVGRISL